MGNFLEELPSWVWFIAWLIGISIVQRLIDRRKDADDEAVFALEENGQGSQAEHLVLYRMNELKELTQYVITSLYLIFFLLAYVIFLK